jgi:hypothetical protein
MIGKCSTTELHPQAQDSRFVFRFLGGLVCFDMVYVAQSGLKLLIFLPPHSNAAGITGMCHHTQLKIDGFLFSFFFFFWQC